MEPTTWQGLDDVRSHFEEQARAGKQPSLEAWLAEAPPESRAALLARLLPAEWAWRRERDEAFDLDDYLARFPAWRDLVEAAWGGWCASADTATQGATFAPGEALPASPSPPPAAPAGYEGLERLGEGGMGVVYKARDLRLKREVALKMLRPEMLQPDLLARFRLEAEALARLRHPHIVQVHAWEEHAGQPVLVLEYVSGGTLEDRLKNGPLSPRSSAWLVAILARAVQAAHSAGVVHRDLKPANVLMAPPVEGNSGTVVGGFPKVSDFGLARLVGRQTVRTTPGAVIGTPDYMAPEQAAGELGEVGPAADVWALGAILYRLLTGRLPFRGNNLFDTLTRIRTVAPAPLEDDLGVPPALARACLRCLEKDPARRPTAARVAEELEAFVRQPEVAAPAPRRRTRRAWLALGAAATALGLGLLLWRGLGGPSATGSPADPAPAPARAAADPLRVRSLRVLWFEQGKAPEDGKPEELGRDRHAARFGDGVRVEAELSRPAYAYLLAFNADGKDQLLLPAGGAAPARSARLRFPPDLSQNLVLNDEPAGGVQAFVVVASPRPLPSYATWKEGRRLPWPARAAGRGVWSCDGAGGFPVTDGRVQRGEVRELIGVPALLPLCRSLRERAEVVEGLAFPVARREAD